MRHETVVQLQDRPVLPSDRPHITGESGEYPLVVAAVPGKPLVPPDLIFSPDRVFAPGEKWTPPTPAYYIFTIES